MTGANTVICRNAALAAEWFRSSLFLILLGWGIQVAMLPQPQNGLEVQTIATMFGLDSTVAMLPQPQNGLEAINYNH